MNREKRNLRVTFKEARKKSLLYPTYQKLSMEQVFTIPPKPGKKQTPILAHTPKTLIVLPVLIHLLISLNDLFTRHLGGIISNSQTTFTLITDFILTSLIFAVTIRCIWQASDIDKCWRKNSKKKNRLIKNKLKKFRPKRSGEDL